MRAAGWLSAWFLPLALASTATAQGRAYDIVLRGGTVVDGTGAAAYRADVAIRGDRIARIAREGIPADQANLAIDARGLVVAPGFIDTHAHVEDLATNPLAESFIRQGVTTVIYAPDGGMPSPRSVSTTRNSAGISRPHSTSHSTPSTPAWAKRAELSVATGCVGPVATDRTSANACQTALAPRRR